MRRLLTGFVIAATATVVPALALAGNQEVAERIANKLRHSGQMSDYKIGVKFQDGTAWLRGRVASEEQLDMALQLMFQISAVNRVVNDLTVASSEAVKTADGESVNAMPRIDDDNPLRGQRTAQRTRQPRQLGLVKRLEAVIKRGFERHDAHAHADRVPSSYTQAAVRPTSAEEPRELPRQMFSQRTQPMARETVRMAMIQPNVRRPMAYNGGPLPMYTAAASQAGPAPARYDQPYLPNYAWPSYAAYPNYASVTYPKQYSPTAWPYIGPFYPYPQVPLGWRKVTLEWDDGWWFLDFKDQPASCWHR